MWQRLGGHPKAIVERNPSGVRAKLEGGEQGSIFETRKKGRRGRKGTPPLSFTPPASPFTFSSSLSRRLRGWRPNRWANFFAAQFNEASLNSLPGAADRSRGTDGGRAAEGSARVGRDEDEGGERESGEAPVSTTIRKSSLGYAAMRAEGKRDPLPLAGSFAPLRLNA